MFKVGFRQAWIKGGARGGCSPGPHFPGEPRSKRLAQYPPPPVQPRWALEGLIAPGLKNLNPALGSDILAGEFAFANSAQGEISHHHLTTVNWPIEVTGLPKGMVE